MNTKLLGRWGEQEAAGHLKKEGYRITAMGYACRFGEIDVIAENRRYVVFAEVKLRKSAAFAEALEFVDRHKQERIRRTAELYLCEHPEQTKQPRFDVIEVYAPFGTETKRPEIRHLEDAFS